MNSYKDIAYTILKEAKKPLHSKEITEIAQKKCLLNTNGKTSEATMNAQLVVDINSKWECSTVFLAGFEKSARIEKVSPPKKSPSKARAGRVMETGEHLSASGGRGGGNFFSATS